MPLTGNEQRAIQYFVEEAKARVTANLDNVLSLIEEEIKELDNAMQPRSDSFDNLNDFVMDHIMEALDDWEPDPDEMSWDEKQDLFEAHTDLGFPEFYEDYEARQMGLAIDAAEYVTQDR